MCSDSVAINHCKLLSLDMCNRGTLIQQYGNVKCIDSVDTARWWLTVGVVSVTVEARDAEMPS